MKLLQNKQVPFLVISLSVLIIALYAIVGIPSTEGLNPSDDGVILAQSYRILNGEIPHRDFISIRPAGSAVMHLVHFVSPLPLELSARWLTLIEYLIYSILISLLLAGSWFKGLSRFQFGLLISGSVIVMFILNQNFYNLFPWTTIDSLFWFSLALYGWYRLKNLPEGSHLGWQALILFAVTCSLLCRQTFVLPGGLLVVRMIIWEIRNQDRNRLKVVFSLLPAILIGLIPGWIYLGVLTATGSWTAFFQQMTGRTEFWATAVGGFWHAFWYSPVLILYVVAVFSGLIKIWNTEAGKDTYWIDFFIMCEKTVSLVVKVALVFVVFIKPGWLFAISYAFFWLLVLDIFLIYLHDFQLPRWIWPVFWILLASWTSAISLGDNAPVFTLGWLAGTAILMQIKDYRNRFYRKPGFYKLAFATLMIPLLLVLSMVVQTRVNYRDLPARQLTRDGGAIFKGLRGIKISEGMSDYLAEIDRIYKESGSPKGRFAVWPNNALIYPLLDSRNPFLLDWMQSAEFVGSDQKVMEATRNKLIHENLIILVEKNNVKWMASDTIQIDNRQADYPYLPLLDTFAKPINLESNFFNVYGTK
ncbi:MAG: hypothetical protein PHY99_01670 [Bacteroidales bacterium]|nr:hypothetical protein [Bacteroidales bacterium]